MQRGWGKQAPSFDPRSLGPRTAAILEEYDKKAEPHHGQATYVPDRPIFEQQLAYGMAISVAAVVVASRMIKEDSDVDKLPWGAGSDYLFAQILSGYCSFKNYNFHTNKFLGEGAVDKIGRAVLSDLGFTVEESDRITQLYIKLLAEQRQKDKKEKT